jgi:cyclopropane-fatty-acyl-phospholipid synthase
MQTAQHAPPRVHLPQGVAAVARRVLEEVADGRLSHLPVTVRFWDGSELRSDESGTVVVRDPVAVAHVVRAPGQLGLARAWVDGSLDVDGI